MKAIGLDIGTTAICGILLDLESGEVLKTESRKNDTFIKGCTFEALQSPEKIIAKLNDILEALYTSDINVIGVTGQMHGIVYTDKDGNAVSPLYTWQDRRGDEPYCGITYALFLSSHSGYGNVTNFYNRVNSLIPEGAVHFCTIHDYAVMKLTGRKAPLVHISDAASFGCYDLGSQSFILNEPLLPETVNDAVTAGTWRGIPVAVAIGDNQASFIGCGCSEDDVLVNIGTGAQVSLSAKGKKAPLGMELRPLNGTQDILVGSSLCGGRAFAALEGFFGEVLEMAGIERIPLYGAMEKSARCAVNTEMSFETLFRGTRSEPDRKASITNITEDNFTPGDMVYSCLKGISRELYNMYSECASASRLVASGNCVRKTALLREIIAEDFSMRLLVPHHCEEASFGAALFASVACGIYRSIKEAERIVQYDI